MDVINIIPREDNENNRQYAYRLIRQNIMTMVLYPGIILSEASISNKLNISRTPVHEALLTLKSEGLVEIFPQSKSKVTNISLANVREGFFFRTHLEPQIYKQIAGCIATDRLDEMQEIINIVASKISSEDGITITEFIKLDDEFHKIAYLTAHKENLWKARLSVCSHYDRVRFQGSVLYEQDLHRIHSEHIELFNYLILGKKPDFDLEEYYQNHLGYFKSFFADIYNKNPEFFSN